MEGLWEFPGGKVKSGENPAAALEREFEEELGVQALCGSPITFAVHEEEGLRILLLFFAASIVSGTPQPLEGQEILWVDAGRLREYKMPPADKDLIAYLSLTGGTSVPKM